MNGSSTISLPSDTSINESPTKLLPPSDADSPAKLPSSAADCQVDNPKGRPMYLYLTAYVCIQTKINDLLVLSGP